MVFPHTAEVSGYPEQYFPARSYHILLALAVQSGRWLRKAQEAPRQLSAAHGPPEALSPVFVGNSGAALLSTGESDTLVPFFPQCTTLRFEVVLPVVVHTFAQQTHGANGWVLSKSQMVLALMSI